MYSLIWSSVWGKYFCTLLVATMSFFYRRSSAFSYLIACTFNCFPIVAMYSHVRMKRVHENVNQNQQIAWFLSMQVKLTGGVITVTKLGKAASQRPQTAYFDFAGSISYCYHCINIFVFGFHFYMTYFSMTYFLVMNASIWHSPSFALLTWVILKKYRLLFRL